MNDDILRYSAFGAHYRLKLAQVALLGSRDFYKFLMIRRNIDETVIVNGEL